MKDNKKIIDNLNTLLTRNYDSKNGYSDAQENIDSPYLKKLFATYINQRVLFIRELETLIATLGGEPEKSESLEGTLHQYWIDLKTYLSSNNEEAALEECKRGETIFLGAYENILEEGNQYPAYIIQLVRKQYIEAKSTFETIQRLEKVYS